MGSRSKVAGKARQFIQEVAENDNLRAIYEPLPEQSRGRVLDSFLFGILTATEPTTAAERCLATLKSENYPTDIERVRAITKDSGMVYWPTKARYVVDFLNAFNADPARFYPREGETCAQ